MFRHTKHTQYHCKPERADPLFAAKMQELIGWFSSFVLVLTISRQIYKQWKEGSSEGVSRWLFIGQMTASLGFTVYSWMVKNWVFAVTNGVMILNGLIGYGITIRHKRRAAREQRS